MCYSMSVETENESYIRRLSYRSAAVSPSRDLYMMPPEAPCRSIPLAR